MSAPIVLVDRSLATGHRGPPSSSHRGTSATSSSSPARPTRRTSGRRCPRATCSADEPAEKALVNQEAFWYAEHDVDLRTGVTP